MKIGFFTNTYFPICYGSVVSIESFRKSLEKLGHQVYVFAPNYPGYQDDNKNIFRYPAFLFKYKIKYPISIPISSFVKSKIEELDLDIIHVHQPFSLGKEGLRFARKLDIPIVFTYHALYEDYVHYVPFLPENLLAELVKKEAVNFSNKCDVVIAPSAGVKKTIENRGVKQESIKILSTGINKSFFTKGLRQKIRSKYKISKEDILCLNVGRIDEEKNLNLLFKSIEKLILENSQIKMMFVGEGFLKEELIKLAEKRGIENNFIFTGFIERQEIKDYFQAADLYLQTSVSETQGMTILEAMAVGLPIVAVKATGTEDFIVDKKNGYLTKNQAKDFSDKVRFLILNPTEAKKIALQAKKDANNYDEISQTKKLESIYKKLVGDNLQPKR